MKARLVQFSVVVTGKVHNPTILNPDFLAIREIVPTRWNCEVAEAITTPPFATVRYRSGVSITVENERLQVVDLGASGDPLKSKATEIARRYVTTLPHVHYAAVGVNFQSVAEVPNPGAVIKDRFLKSGPWDNSNRPLDAVGMRFVYCLDNCRLVLSLDTGQAKDEEGEGAETKDVIIANANFHRDCKGYPADEQAVTHLTHVAEDWSRYNTLLADTFLTEG